jgi:hypothetical protein
MTPTIIAGSFRAISQKQVYKFKKERKNSRKSYKILNRLKLK